MSLLKSKWLKLLLVIIPSIIFIVMANILISVSIAFFILVQLLAKDVGNMLSLGAAFLVAVGIQCFIIWNHKIWEYIKNYKESK